MTVTINTISNHNILKTNNKLGRYHFVSRKTDRLATIPNKLTLKFIFKLALKNT